MESTGTWTYDTSPNGIGQLASENTAGFARTFTYDNLSRPIATVTNIDGESYRQEATYDRSIALERPCSQAPSCKQQR